MHTLRIALMLVACLGTTAPAFAAGYLKIGDIKGESTDDAHQTTPSAPARIRGQESPRPAGLLLPAVQKAREAASRSGKSKGKVEYTWKIEEGRK